MCNPISTPSLPSRTTTTTPTMPPAPQPIVKTKRQKRVDTRPSAEVPAELGELIDRDIRLVQEMGWEEFVKSRRGRGDLTEMIEVEHPARRILRRYAHRGVPVQMHEKSGINKKWMRR